MSQRVYLHQVEMVYESLKKTDLSIATFSFMKPIGFQIYRQKS